MLQRSTEQPKEEEEDGLSTGGIVGIALGTAAVAGAGTFSIAWFVVQKKSVGELIGLVKTTAKASGTAIKSAANTSRVVIKNATLKSNAAVKTAAKKSGAAVKKGYGKAVDSVKKFFHK